jgi:hypothetical protein
VVLDHPRLTGRYRGYPWSSDVVRASSRSAFRPLLNTMPGGLRRHVLQRFGRELRAAAVLAGPPSVAHAEALLRGIALRGTALDEPLDTIVVPVPWKAPHQPRAPLNPITVAATALGIVLRLWCEQAPLREGGTVVLLHDLQRAFGHGPQAPFRTLFQALRDGREPGLVATARAAARDDPRALAAYRRAVHRPAAAVAGLESGSRPAPGRDGDRGRLPRRGPPALGFVEPQRRRRRDGARSGRRPTAPLLLALYAPIVGRES